MSRIKFAIKNSFITLIVQITSIFIGFVVRKQFINSLGLMYLGYNSVFNNILSFLNLTELGIGVAITSFLYYPLARNLKEDITALMYIYKRIYRIIALFVGFTGLCLIPFLPVFIPDSHIEIIYLTFLYLINVIGTVSTYLLSYRRTLLIADQKSYVVNINDLIFNILLSIVQILFLQIGCSYEIFLLINVVRIILSNLFIKFQSNKIYPFLNSIPSNKLVITYRKRIFTYVKDIFVSKIGGFIFNSTDNLIISSFMGSLTTGLLSNYTLIIAQIQNIISHFLSSLQATFGNYISNVEDKYLIEKMFLNYLFLNYSIANFCIINFVFLIQPFINLYLASDFLLTIDVVIILGINLYLFIILQLLSQMFVIFQLYKYDKIIVIISAALNIVVSIGLVNVYGIIGVLIGTLFTSLVYLFSRTTILYLFVFRSSCIRIIYTILKYFIYTIVELLMFSLIIDINSSLSIYGFVLRGFYIFVINTIFFFVFFYKRDEFLYFRNKIGFLRK